MNRKKLPHLLQGQFSFVKNILKKMYRDNAELLKSDDEWYKNVITKPDETFSFLYDKKYVFSDLETMFDYVGPSEEELSQVEAKYGERHPYFVVMEYLI